MSGHFEVLLRITSSIPFRKNAMPDPLSFRMLLPLRSSGTTEVTTEMWGRSAQKNEARASDTELFTTQCVTAFRFVCQVTEPLASRY